MAWLNEYIEETYGDDTVMDDDRDIQLFDEQQGKARAIFMERRDQYGNHLDNARRFPMEDKCGLYLKCVRMVRDIESGGELREDTLIDLANYTALILSAREDRCKSST